MLGGVTSIFEMPNTHPLTLWEADLRAKLEAAQGRACRRRSAPARAQDTGRSQRRCAPASPHLHAGRLSLPRLVDLTSAGPARIFGIEGKGRITLGYDADLTLVDLAARRTICNDWIASCSGWTPYDGMAITGWPIHTVIRGQVVVRDGQLMGLP